MAAGLQKLFAEHKIVYILTGIFKLDQFFFDIFSILVEVIFSKFKKLCYEPFPWNSLTS